MSLYEHVFIARQDISPAEIEKLVTELTAVLEDNGGRVLKKELPGLQNLAYRIKKMRKGFYVLLHIDAPAAAIAEFERRLRLNEDIIRMLTIRQETLDPGPSMLTQAKAYRDERIRRDISDNYRPKIEENIVIETTSIVGETV